LLGILVLFYRAEAESVAFLAMLIENQRRLSNNADTKKQRGFKPVLTVVFKRTRFHKNNICYEWKKIIESNFTNIFNFNLKLNQRCLG
jgi:hypothetical protein